MDTASLEDVTARPKAERLSRENLIERFKKIRAFSLQLAEPLEKEDYVVQAMENTSPAKWHLAHVSWFFETFLLKKVHEDYESMHPQYSYIFNSYYLQTGEPHSRSKRGLLTRPTVDEVMADRKSVV